MLSGDVALLPPGVFMSKKAYQGKIWLVVSYSNKDLGAG